MAIAKAEGNLSFKVLPDEIRKRFNGTMTCTGADTDDKWVYAKVQVVYNKDDILTSDDDYLMTPTTSVATGDKYKFLMIKHTGWTDSNENVKSVYGVMIAIDAGTPAYNDANLLFLAPGDTMTLKLPNCTVGGLHARTCTIANGVPTADGSSGQNVLIEVAAILEDVA